MTLSIALENRMNETSSIRIFLVDSHEIVRIGLKQLLEPIKDCQIVGEAESGVEAVRMSRHSDANLLIIEINLHDRNGIDVIKQIKKESPHLAILVFSNQREDQYAIRALKAGASGYLNKSAHSHEILDAIQQVTHGLKYISPELAQEMANNLQQEHEDEPHRGLSDREFQTLKLIASGKSVSDIAKELSLSVKTISEYRARVLTKMRLRHNAELTHYAIKNQLVE
jgi:two-component system invasion response regulator UvrY